MMDLGQQGATPSVDSFWLQISTWNTFNPWPFLQLQQSNGGSGMLMMSSLL